MVHSFEFIGVRARSVLVALAVAMAMMTGAVRAQDRVISTDAGITSIVSALDAEPILVAVDASSVVQNDQPALPRVGYHRALSAEGMLSLRPDLVLLSEHAGPATALRSLERANVPTFRVVSPRSPDDLKANITRIGAELNRHKKAERIVETLDARLDRLTSRGFDSADSLFLRVANGTIRVAGTNTAGDGLLSLIEGRNIGEFPGYRTYSVEALLQANPEIMVIALGNDESLAQFLSDYPLLKHTRAARKGQLFAVPGSSLVGGVSLATVSEAERILDASGSGQVAVQ